MAWIRPLAFLALFSIAEALVRPDAQQACFQQHCFGCSGEPCLLCKLQYCSAGTPTPVDANGCNCEWISSDDCQKQDACANSCRAANPWGPCGRGIVSHQPVAANGCDCKWISSDDCIKHDQCAVDCRAANPWGRCGGFVNVEPQKDESSSIPPLTNFAVATQKNLGFVNVEPQKDESLALQPLNETEIESQKNKSSAPQQGGLQYPIDAHGCSCWFIIHDNCMVNDLCHIACRGANPWGPCGDDGGPHSPPDVTAVPQAQLNLAAASTKDDPCYEHCFGCSGEQCVTCQQTYCTGGGGGSQTPVSANDCNCDWIPEDDCNNQDQCAIDCRAANPWGRCGNGLDFSTNTQPNLDLVAVRSRLDPAALVCYQQHCFGCSGEQCLYCQQLYCSSPGGGSRTPVNTKDCTCDWIPNDDCIKHDHCAVACRRANAWGRCGNGLELSTNTVQLVALGSSLDPSTLICYQQRCLGCSGEQCLYCQQLYCSGSGGDSRTPVDANGCKCDWIPRDDCQKTDRCARTCRAANPWGRCGGFVNLGVESQKDELPSVQSQMNFAVAKVMFTSTCFQENCFGCSGEQCLDCLEKTCGGK